MTRRRRLAMLRVMLAAAGPIGARSRSVVVRCAEIAVCTAYEEGSP